MNEELLRSVMLDAGFETAEFSYSHKSFGSWYAVVVKGSTKRRLVFDGKGSHLSIQSPDGHDWKDITFEKVQPGDKSSILARCKEWLTVK